MLLGSDTRGDERWCRFRCRFDKRPALPACVPCIAQPHVRAESVEKENPPLSNREHIMTLVKNFSRSGKPVDHAMKSNTAR